MDNDKLLPSEWIWISRRNVRTHNVGGKTYYILVSNSGKYFVNELNEPLLIPVAKSINSDHFYLHENYYNYLFMKKKLARPISYKNNLANSDRNKFGKGAKAAVRKTASGFVTAMPFGSKLKPIIRQTGQVFNTSFNNSRITSGRRDYESIVSAFTRGFTLDFGKDKTYMKALDSKLKDPVFIQKVKDFKTAEKNGDSSKLSKLTDVIEVGGIIYKILKNTSQVSSDTTIPVIDAILSGLSYGAIAGVKGLAGLTLAAKAGYDARRVEMTSSNIDEDTYYNIEHSLSNKTLRKNLSKTIAGDTPTPKDAWINNNNDKARHSYERREPVESVI